MRFTLADIKVLKQRTHKVIRLEKVNLRHCGLCSLLCRLEQPKQYTIYNLFDKLLAGVEKVGVYLPEAGIMTDERWNVLAIINMLTAEELLEIANA